MSGRPRTRTLRPRANRSGQPPTAVAAVVLNRIEVPPPAQNEIEEHDPAGVANGAPDEQYVLPPMVQIHYNGLKTVRDFIAGDRFELESVIALETRLEMLSHSWQQFSNEFNGALLQLDGIRSQDFFYQKHEVAQEMYIESRTLIKTRIQNLSVPAVVAPAEPRVIKVQLTDFSFDDKIPKFKGNFLEWAAFKDAFVNDVDKNPNLDARAKLRQLQRSVQGAAAEAMGGWALIPENYPLAWAALCRIYDQDFQCIRAHIQALFNCQTIQTPNYENLRGLLNTFTNAHRQLLLLLSHQEITEYMLFHMMELRLDSATREQWQLSQPNDRKPTLANLTQFLENRCRAIFEWEDSTGAEAAEKETANGSRAAKKPRTESARSNATKGATPKRSLTCVICKEEHLLHKCDRFLAYSVSRRREAVGRNRLCFNCFKPSHERPKEQRRAADAHRTI